MIQTPLVKEVLPNKVEVPLNKVEIVTKKEDILSKKEEILPKKVDIPTKPVVVSPILYKIREVSAFQEQEIAEALKESGADSRAQITVLEKILKILKTV
jgi:hypothetical protein